jgi:hypothetical protein
MKRQVGDLGNNLGFVADLTDDAARQRLHGFHYPIGGNRFFTLFACQYVDSRPALSKMTVGLYRRRLRFLSRPDVAHQYPALP